MGQPAILLPVPVSRLRPKPLSVSEYRTLDQLQSLASEWNALLDGGPRPALYSTFEWLSTWWSCHARPGRELYVLAVRDGSEIVGIAPLMKIRRRVLGVPIVKIEFLSMMQEALSVRTCSASLDFLVAGHGREVIAAIASHLVRDPDWHYVRLHPVPEDSSNLAAFRVEMARRRFRLLQRFAFHNATLSVTGNWEDYQSGLPGKFRRLLRSRLRKLENIGPVTVVTGREPGDPSRLYQEILSVERRSWKGSAGLALDDHAHRNFYRRMLEVASARGWLRLWRLRVGERTIAYDYGIEYGGSVEILKGSYDEAFREFGVGQLLMLRELEDCFRSGARRVNLLWGSLDYKMRWASDLDPHLELYAFRNSRMALLLHTLYVRTSLHEGVRMFVRAIDRAVCALGWWRRDHRAGTAPDAAAPSG